MCNSEKDTAKSIDDLIIKLADEAVSEGRMNWDGYYGHNNDYHLSDIKTWKTFIDLKNYIKEITNGN